MSTAEAFDPGVDADCIHSHCRQKTDVSVFLDQWKRGLYMQGHIKGVDEAFLFINFYYVLVIAMYVSVLMLYHDVSMSI